jgi:2-phospho-L-lactate guanylyltransferase
MGRGSFRVNVWAIVPVKPLNRAKSRLAATLSPEVRERLAGAMLVHTLTAIHASQAVSGMLVISRDNRALVLARRHGARTVQESGQPELNPALERASQVIASWNAQAALVLPADLPLLMAADIEGLVQQGRYQQSVVITPDRQEVGTNALLMRPPGLIPFLFGETSFAKHIAAAEAAGAAVHVYRSERLMLDLDTPDDLALYIDLCKKYEQAPLMGLATENAFPMDVHKERP